MGSRDDSEKHVYAKFLVCPMDWYIRRLSILFYITEGIRKWYTQQFSLVTILDVLCVIRPIINKGYALTEYVAALKPWVHFISPFSEYLQLMKWLLWVSITSGWSSSTWWIGLKVQFEFMITLMIYWLPPHSLSKFFNNYQIDCHG